MSQSKKHNQLYSRGAGTGAEGKKTREEMDATIVFTPDIAASAIFVM